MIEMDPLDVAPPEEAVRSPAVPRPKPESDPVDIFEVDRFLRTPTANGEKDRAVLFSGGDDSLALTHKAMEEGWADMVVHLETNTSIPANLDYVREVCEQYQWPLVIVSSPVSLETLAFRYGFPGPSAHTIAFNALKGRQLGYLYRRTNGGIKFFSGVRTDESDRRMRQINAEVQYATPDGSNFRGWWVSPLIGRSNEWIHEYREEHELPRNPVAQSSLHRSGDCNCLAYGHRDEELIALEADWPNVAEWLKSVETRVQEYRGRVDYLRETHPEVAAEVDTQRKRERPHPMRLTILKEEAPDVYEEVVSLSVSDAITMGQTDEVNYIGHGGLSSDEMRSLLASMDTCQQTLCENCGKPSESVSCSVERRVEAAEEALIGPSTTQETLPVDVPTDTHEIITDGATAEAPAHDQSDWAEWT